MIYIASPTIVQSTRDGLITRQVPTFLLDSNIQGILSETHAAKIVTDICNPTNNPDVIVHASVFRSPA